MPKLYHYLRRGQDTRFDFVQPKRTQKKWAQPGIEPGTTRKFQHRVLGITPEAGIILLDHWALWKGSQKTQLAHACIL